MSDDYTLYGGLPPHVDQDTSIEAALSMLESASTLRGRVYRYIDRLGSKGATDDEIEIASGLIHQTVSARRRELVLLNVVVDSGEKRTTRSGRRAIVWIAVRKPGQIRMAY